MKYTLFYSCYFQTIVTEQESAEVSRREDNSVVFWTSQKGFDRIPYIVDESESKWELAV